MSLISNFHSQNLKEVHLAEWPRFRASNLCPNVYFHTKAFRQRMSESFDKLVQEIDLEKAHKGYLTPVSFDTKRLQTQGCFCTRKVLFTAFFNTCSFTPRSFCSGNLNTQTGAEAFIHWGIYGQKLFTEVISHSEALDEKRWHWHRRSFVHRGLDKEKPCQREAWTQTFLPVEEFTQEAFTQEI